MRNISFNFILFAFDIESCVTIPFQKNRVTKVMHKCLSLAQVLDCQGERTVIVNGRRCQKFWKNAPYTKNRETISEREISNEMSLFCICLFPRITVKSCFHQWDSLTEVLQTTFQSFIFYVYKWVMKVISYKHVDISRFRIRTRTPLGPVAYRSVDLYDRKHLLCQATIHFVKKVYWTPNCSHPSNA